MGRRKKKKDTVKIKNAPDPNDGVPRSFVIHQKGGPEVEQLVGDLRSMMAPNTALKLKVKKKNVLKDFVHMAGPFGVTHMMVLNQTDTGLNLRIARLPRGPTLTFRVASFCNTKNLIRSLPNPKSPGAQFLYSPLVVCNNFAAGIEGDKEDLAKRMLITTFQNMFPSVNVSAIQLKQLRRTVLFQNDPETDSIHLRHYEIGVRPAGLAKSVKGLLRKNTAPNLSKFADISDYILGGGDGYESDASDIGEDKVTLPQTMQGAGNKASSQSAVKLTELGPRMELKLLKIEEGFCEGHVLWNKNVTKTPAEVEALNKKRAAARRLKDARRAEQAKNVERKKEAKRLNKIKSIKGQKKDKKDTQEDDFVENPESEIKAEDSEDDAQYYRDEVGEEPDADLFPKRSKRTKKTFNSGNSKDRNSKDRNSKDRNTKGGKDGYTKGINNKRKTAAASGNKQGEQRPRKKRKN
eukprot:m.74530 g.74530  ORF g.74530 m.74530 type:complete len:464 (-) comp12469_c0_seq1:35-1426(-)